METQKSEYFTHAKERFFSYDDAELWLSRNLAEIKANDWTLLEARLVYIEEVWHAGVSFSAT